MARRQMGPYLVDHVSAPAAPELPVGRTRGAARLQCAAHAGSPLGSVHRAVQREMVRRVTQFLPRWTAVDIALGNVGELLDGEPTRRVEFAPPIEDRLD